MQQVYMNARCKAILHMLVESDTYLPQQQIADAMNISKRSIYYDICRINEWLEFHHIPEVEMVRGKGLRISRTAKEMISECSEQIEKDDNYILSPTERGNLILCIIVYMQKPVYIDVLIDYCGVSRNTVFNDLRILTNQLLNYDLKLEYEPKSGYRIGGDPIKVRAIFLMCFHELHPLFERPLFDFVDRQQIAQNIEKLNHIEDELKTKYVEGNLDALAALLPIMAEGNTELHFQNLKKNELAQTREFRMIQKYFPDLIETEQIYLCLHLLGARVTVVSNDIFEEDSNQKVYEITKALISEFEKIACVKFEDEEELGRALFVHINSSLYRYQYGIQIIDSMSEDIIREYPDLFDITKIVSKYIERQIGLPIQDAEVAYLSLHFGAHLPIANVDRVALRILVVCANGISTGHMLKRELQKLLPDAEIVAVIAEEDVQDAKSICDIIISTVKITSEVPVVHVHPILTGKDKEEILRHVKNTTAVSYAENLFTLIKPYVNKVNHSVVHKCIEEYLLGAKPAAVANATQPANRLLDFLTLDHIRIYDGEYRWTEAIRECGKCLLKAGSIQKQYIDTIISQLRYYGPYMFITSRVVLAHSKPEDGVNQLDVSLHIFKKSVPFSDFHEANVIIMLAAKDQESHLRILRDMLEVFSIQTKIDDILQQNTSEEVLEYLRKALKYEEE